MRNLGRRQFLTLTGAGLLAATRGGQALATHQTSDVDAAFDRWMVVDALSADQEWDGATFAAAREAGLTAIHTSLSNRNFAVAMKDLAAWNALFEAQRDRLLKVTAGDAFAEAKKSGRIAVLLGFQNATIVDSDVRNVDKLHAEGARCIQLTYNSRNLLGDGCTERTNAGLSDFGIAVVERMNALGIVVDLSHCGEQTSKDGIEFSKRPAAFTHTVCKAVHNHVRGKSDALIKAMSDKGGMTGITTLGYFVGPTDKTSVDDYIRHIDHAVKVGGIDHVGIASDHAIRGIMATHTRESWYVPRLTAFKPIYNVRWPPNIPALDPPARYRVIARALAGKGYRTAQIEKILGGNWVRFFTDALKPAA